MPMHQEKKYKVKSFDKVKNALEEASASGSKENTTVHYYAQQPGNSVIKLVHYEDKDEIHILEEQGGKFSLTETVPVSGTTGGLQWLKDHDYETAGVVKMVNINYPYRDGVVGLYTINDFLSSIILDFPAGAHNEIEKELGLEKAEVIALPYNKYLESIGRLETIQL